MNKTTDMDKFIIGGDPEFFAYNNKTEKYVSLIPYIKGTKDEPEPIEVQGCFHLIDNVSVEFNFPPVKEYWMLKMIIDECIGYTNNWLSKINPDLSLKVTSTASFSEEELNSDIAMIFGCTPAYSVYSKGKEVYRPSPQEVGSLRTASYHLHYGWEQEYSKEDLYKFMVLNDIFLGFPALFKDKTDLHRKTVYGSLSEHRIKSRYRYEALKEASRIEYRTLGAGIHLYPDFVENGINLVRQNANKLDYYMELYYKDLEELNLDLFNEKLQEKLKNKLIKNGDFNDK